MERLAAKQLTAAAKKHLKNARAASKTVLKAPRIPAGAYSVARMPNTNDQEAAATLTSLYVNEIQFQNYNVSIKMSHDEKLLKRHPF